MILNEKQISEKPQIWEPDKANNNKTIIAISARHSPERTTWIKNAIK